jgi:hypothetical protein
MNKDKGMLLAADMMATGRTSIMFW